MSPQFLDPKSTKYYVILKRLFLRVFPTGSTKGCNCFHFGPRTARWAVEQESIVHLLTLNGVYGGYDPDLFILTFGCYALDTVDKSPEVANHTPIRQ